MKVLLLTDKLNWAYHSIAQSLQKYNSDKKVSLSVEPIKSNEAKIKKTFRKYDRILVMGWQTYNRVRFIGKLNVMIGLHSHHSWDKRRTKPDKDVNPPKPLVQFLSKFYGVNAVSKKLYDLFKNNGLENIHYTPNGVDTEIFKCQTNDMSKKFTVGYSGSKGHDWRKGVTDLILPSAKMAKVRTKIAMSNSNSYIPLKKMPEFYRGIDCYICASLSEGFSLSVLEAAASGCVIITTKVGGTEELIKDGYNGFLVDRNIEAISNKICILKNDSNLFSTISRNMRNFVVDNYGWDKTTPAWIKFLKE